MKLDTKTALGIDISDGRIHLALLKRNKNRIELIKSASGPVPEGAIKDGNIVDPALLARGIRALKSHSHIRVRLRQAAVSLVARPMLMQILQVPNQVPTSIGQFVHNEAKHCVALSGRTIASDFCGIGSAGRPGSDRLFAVAVDSQNVAQIVRACNLARVNVEVIEPPMLSYARAFYTKKIAGRFDCNVLIAIVQGGILTLCVFKRQAIDFVRTRDINEDKADPGELCKRLVEEINAIIQFYDSGGDSDSLGKWEVTVVADSVQLPEDTEESLRAKLIVSSLQVRRPQDACQDTSIVSDSAQAGTDTSVVAIGLAMKLLASDESNLKINLLPPEAAEVKSVKRHAIITANIIAAVLFGMVIAIGGLMLMIEKTNENIARKKQEQSLKNISTLLREERVLDRQIKQLSDGPGRLNEILSSRRDGNWLGILNDLRNKAPKTVRVTSLFSKGNSEMFLEGLALSYEAVRLFVNMLDKSEHVDLASLHEAEKDEEFGLVRYEISCSLASAEGK